MLVAGVRTLGGKVETLEVEDPRPLSADEVLIDVRCAGVGNWDNIIRYGGWDVGTTPPLALGVEAAGVIKAVGDRLSGFSVGDEVLCHPVPLRGQGTWAPVLIAPVGSLARKPPELPWDTAAIFPVPALTAEQVVGEALALHSGETLLVHGAGGITGGLIVQLAALRGVDVLATAGPAMTAILRRLSTLTLKWLGRGAPKARLKRKDSRCGREPPNIPVRCHSSPSTGMGSTDGRNWSSTTRPTHCSARRLSVRSSPNWFKQPPWLSSRRSQSVCCAMLSRHIRRSIRSGIRYSPKNPNSPRY